MSDDSKIGISTLSYFFLQLYLELVILVSVFPDTVRFKNLFITEANVKKTLKCPPSKGVYIMHHSCQGHI